LSNGTLLDFEVEYANGSQQLAIYHVRLPNVSSTVNNNFTMRYGGDQDFSGGFQSTSVWRSDYVFVSHMGATLLDSTGNQTLTNTGTTSQRVANSFVRSFDRSSSDVITTAGAVPITATHTQLIRLLPLGQIGSLNYEVFHVNRNFWNGKNYPANNSDYNLINNMTPVATGVRSIGSAGSANLLNWVNASQLSNALGITVRNDDFAIQLKGFFIPQETGTYQFTIEGDDAVELFMENRVIAAHYNGHGIGSLGSHTERLP
jgi:hypothetical protein